MNLWSTQFAVAFVAILFLGACTLAAVIAQAFFDGPTDLTFALITGLTGTTSAATAFLFRLNGKSGGT